MYYLPSRQPDAVTAVTIRRVLADAEHEGKSRLTLGAEDALVPPLQPDRSARRDVHVARAQSHHHRKPAEADRDTDRKAWLAVSHAVAWHVVSWGWEGVVNVGAGHSGFSARAGHLLVRAVPRTTILVRGAAHAIISTLAIVTLGVAVPVPEHGLHACIRRVAERPQVARLWATPHRVAEETDAAVGAVSARST